MQHAFSFATPKTLPPNGCNQDKSKLSMQPAPMRAAARGRASSAPYNLGTAGDLMNRVETVMAYLNLTTRVWPVAYLYRWPVQKQTFEPSE
eukprot:COSAG02_NODE_3732_length_6312_cov_10.672944_1_plen_91_part_00